MVKNPQKGHVRKILVQSASHRPVRKIVTANTESYTEGLSVPAPVNVSCALEYVLLYHLQFHRGKLSSYVGAECLRKCVVAYGAFPMSGS